MMNRLTIFGLLALVLLVAGCAEEIEAPTAAWVGNEGVRTYVDDPFATAINPGDSNGADYIVYTPNGYTESGTAFPVVYLLHGYGGDEHMFSRIFGLLDAADAMIAAGELDPMVLVLVNGDNDLGGSFYTNSGYPLVQNSADHVLNTVAEVEANYNVMTTADGKGIAGLSMGGYGALSLALDNPGTWGSVAVASAPVAFWGTKTFDPADDTYTGIEELLPSILAQTGYDPSTDTPADYQTKMDPSVGPPTSMMFAMAAAFSPTDPGNPGPTSHAATGVDLPIGLDGEIYMPVWQKWMARDVLNRIVNPDPAINDAASLFTFELYMTVGLEDDLGLHGAHQVLEQALPQVGYTAFESHYYNGVNDVFGEIPAGHVTQAREQFENILQWHAEKFAN